MSDDQLQKSARNGKAAGMASNDDKLQKSGSEDDWIYCSSDRKPKEHLAVHSKPAAADGDENQQNNSNDAEKGNGSDFTFHFPNVRINITDKGLKEFGERISQVIELIRSENCPAEESIRRDDRPGEEPIRLDDTTLHEENPAVHSVPVAADGGSQNHPSNDVEKGNGNDFTFNFPNVRINITDQGLKEFGDRISQVIECLRSEGRPAVQSSRRDDRRPEEPIRREDRPAEESTHREDRRPEESSRRQDRPKEPIRRDGRPAVGSLWGF